MTEIIEKPSIRLLVGYDAVAPDKISLDDDLLTRNLVVEESYGRSTRKRKHISYDVNAMVKEERRTSHIAAKAARREKSAHEAAKRRAKRRKLKEERLEREREEREAGKWTSEKKEQLISKYNELKSLCLKNYGKFKYKSIIRDVYKSHGYSKWKHMRRFKKKCLDDVNEWIEFYLKDERNTNLQKGTTEQYGKIESLYADLYELLESDNIDESDRNQIQDRLDAYVATLPASKDENGNCEMDLDALNYLQCKNFIDILLECLVYARASINRKSYSRYQTSLVELKQKIKNYKNKTKL
tara:strand:- start:692 stop:1585 length:894 start_codon:yes stop_codon:yes gene_type:complete